MKNILHYILWIAAIAAVVWVIITDGWFADNWLWFGVILLAFLVGLWVGIEEGEKRHAKKIRGAVKW